MQQQRQSGCVARQGQKAEASAKALVKAAEELGPLPRNLGLLNSSLSLLANAFDLQHRYHDVLATRLRSLQLLEQYHGKEIDGYLAAISRITAREKEASAYAARAAAIRD